MQETVILTDCVNELDMENGNCGIVDAGNEVTVADVVCDTATGKDHAPGYSDLVKVRGCVVLVMPPSHNGGVDVGQH